MNEPLPRRMIKAKRREHGAVDWLLWLAFVKAGASGGYSFSLVWLLAEY
jgi:hypothetical protein